MEHKRRVRYKGTHPRNFHEKYKEANPEKYQEVIEKVIRKGSTPAGMHISIMVEEILQVLRIQPGEQGLDATLGYGGHTRAMLEKLEGQGRMVALDVDPIEIEKTRERLRSLGYEPPHLTICRTNFAQIDEVAKQEGKFDFVLADLGVSSMQIDTPERGFSYKVDAPLDLRLDPSKGESAAERLQSVTREELIGMLQENADEPYAEEIANVLCTWRKKGNPVKTTQELKRAVEEGVKKGREKQKGRQAADGQTLSLADEIKKSCARVFQALRIDINSEFEVLYAFMEKLPEVLKPGARVAILTFHSGEDRLVKKALKQGLQEGIYEEISKEVIRPGREECYRNPRAKVAKLRYAVRARD